MNPGAVIASSLFLSLVGAYGVVQLTSSPADSELTPATADPTAALQDEIEALRQEIQELKSARPSAPAERATVTADLDARIAAAVAEALANRGAGATDAIDPSKDLNVDAMVVELVESGTVNPHVNQVAWEKIAQAGKVDEVVEAFKRRAEENPESADAHADYGEAIGAKLMHAESQMDQMKLAFAQDSAYDKALEADSSHWRARFNKAVSYTFWPAITGKPAEAVTHFQTLMDQQEANPAAGHGGYDQTYLMLGNMYKQQGKEAEAKEVWQRGLRHHPDSGALKGVAGN